MPIAVKSSDSSHKNIDTGEAFLGLHKMRADFHYSIRIVFVAGNVIVKFVQTSIEKLSVSPESQIFGQCFAITEF